MTEFSNPILAGDVLVRQAMESENFVSGSAGWRVARDGTAEFQSITARGDIEATSLHVEESGAEVVIDSTLFGSPAVPLIRFLTGDNDEVEVAEINARNDPHLDIESPSFNGNLNRSQIIMDGENADSSQLAKIRFFVAGGAVPDEILRITENGLQSSAMRPQKATDTTNDPVSSDSYIHGSEGVGFSFTAPPSGMVRIDVSYALIIQPSADALRRIFGGFEIRQGSTVGSGTIETAATDANSVQIGSSTNGHRADLSATKSILVDGLVPGDSYNIRSMHRLNLTSNINTATDDNRELIVTPQP